MDLDGSSVEDLVRRAQAGDEVAWNGLVDRYAPLVLSVAHRFRLDPADVQDVVQTLWLRLVEHLGAIREPAALPGWIVTTVRHECLRTLRLRRRSDPFDPLDPVAQREAPDAVPVDVDVVENLAREAVHDTLLAAFADLSTLQRELLLLLVEDPPPSYAEIGRRLGIPVGSIGPTRTRALQRLRAHPAVVAALATEPSPDESSRTAPARRRVRPAPSQ